MIKKDIKINGMNVASTTFNDIEEVVKYLDKAETSSNFKNKSLSSQKKKDSGFNETENFEEAKNFLEYRL